MPSPPHQRSQLCFLSMAYPTCQVSYLSQSWKIISLSLLCVFVSKNVNVFVSSCISIFVSKSVRALVTSFLSVFVITMETVFNKHDDMKLIILSMNLMTQSANDGSSLALIITIIITSGRYCIASSFFDAAC